jgi:uncharacterized protein
MNENSVAKQSEKEHLRNERSEICRKGAAALRAQGKAHKFTSEEARLAGKIGGQKTASKYGRSYFVELAKKGRAARANNKLNAAKTSNSNAAKTSS